MADKEQVDQDALAAEWGLSVESDRSGPAGSGRGRQR